LEELIPMLSLTKQSIHPFPKHQTTQPDNPFLSPFLLIRKAQ